MSDLDDWWNRPDDFTPTPQPKLSAGVLRTVRAKLAIAGGRHPFGLPLRQPVGQHTCGDCGHHLVWKYAKRYHKCGLNLSHGPSTDVRVSWPACTAWVALHSGRGLEIKEDEPLPMWPWRDDPPMTVPGSGVG